MSRHPRPAACRLPLAACRLPLTDCRLPFAAATVTLSPEIGPSHRRRLRALWRSAGWPFQDLIEVELLAAGLLTRERDSAGRETVRVTDAGVAVLAQTLQANRAVRNAHETLVARVASEMQRAGRVVWRGLSLRARVGAMPVVAGGVGTGGEAALTAAVDQVALDCAAGVDAECDPVSSLASSTASGNPSSHEPGHEPGPQRPLPLQGAWAMVMPDVYSIRHTTVEDYVEPAVHEIKVQRSDLLADLRRPAKGEAYRWLSGECWYVIREGIAQPQEIPEVYGVLLALSGGGLEVARPAPRRAMRLPFAVWMALARATAEPGGDDGARQLPLGGLGDA